jgi:hypothetical protein
MAHFWRCLLIQEGGGGANLCQFQGTFVKGVVDFFTYSCFMNLGIQGHATLPRHSDIHLQFRKVPQFVTIGVKTYFFLQKTTI